MHSIEIMDTVLAEYKPKDRADRQTEARKKADCEGTCFVCFESVPNTINNPCRHGGVCDLCAKEVWRLKGRDCLVCGTSLKSVIVYEYADGRSKFRCDEIS